MNFTPHSFKPELFHLRRIGLAEPLIHIAKQYVVDTNGVPLELSLTSGAVQAPGQGDLRVELSTKHYPWNLAI